MNILASSRTGLWINETITKKRNELRDCMRSMETATPEPHQGLSSTTTKSTIYWDRKGFWACHTPKRSGGWYDHPSTSSSSSSWQAASWWKSSSWNERQFFVKRTRGVFAYTQCRFLCKQRCVHQTPNPHAMSRSRTRDFSRAVFHSLSCQRLSHAQHVHVAQGPHGSRVVSSQKHSSSHLVQHGTQYTFSDDPTIIEHFSLALQSVLRPDPSMGLLQISSSDEIYFHDDLINVSFGLVADLHSPTGWENNDLAESDNLVQVEQSSTDGIWHRLMHDSAENIETSPPESDLDNEHTDHAGFSPLYLQEPRDVMQTSEKTEVRRSEN